MNDEPKRRGRPLKNGVRHDHEVRIYLSSREFEQLTEKAQVYGMTRGEYVRQFIMSDGSEGAALRLTDAEIDRIAERIAAKIGNN